MLQETEDEAESGDELVAEDSGTVDDVDVDLAKRESREDLWKILQPIVVQMPFVRGIFGGRQILVRRWRISGNGLAKQLCADWATEKPDDWFEQLPFGFAAFALSSYPLPRYTCPSCDSDI